MIDLPILTAQDVAKDAPGKKFWRSYSDLHNDPSYKAIVKNEFMPGASEAPSGTSRRQFLQLMGASMALAGLSACRRPVQTIVPYTRKPEEIIPGIPMQYATAMPHRGSVRGLLVESHEGRPTKVEGNADHPAQHGSTGVFHQASILNLYDPDRSRTILRDGDTATWSDFVTFAQQLSANAASQRVAVLCEPTSSPSVAALRQQLSNRFAQLTWITYAAEGDNTAQMGMQMAFGQPYRPHYAFSEAQVIVSLDADFLNARVRNSESNNREFANSRRVHTPSDTMSRLYVAESYYSATGAMADHRKRVRSSEIAGLANAIAAGLGVAGVTTTAFADDPFVVALVADLQSAGSRGLVVAGENQPAEVHAVCAAINSALGAVGTTLVLLDAGEASLTPQGDAMQALVSDINAGNVDTLIMMGVNPVYDAPAALNFAAAMRTVTETIHLGSHVDETATAARWHIPKSHYLEAWGDGRSYEGTLSVIQPLIAPLYDSKSDIELLNLLATNQDLSGYDIVRSTWQGAITGSFEDGWRRVLHDGYLPNTTFPLVTPAAGAVAAAPEASMSGLEVVFRLDPTVLDGTYANNAWMQELPDPITKIVWDNVVTMSPATAEELGLVAEYRVGQYYVDVVTVTANGQGVDLPVWILPGHADNVLTVTMGYGRSVPTLRDERITNFFDLDDKTDIYGHGSIASGVGQNVAPLRAASFSSLAAAQVTEVASNYMIATTQDHGALDIEARPIYRMGTLAEYQANPTFIPDAEKLLPGGEPWAEYPTLWEENHPSEQNAYRDTPYYKNQWGMVIDLNTCTGCNACITACQAENNIQVVGKDEVSRGREMSWIRLDRYFVTEGADDTSEPQMALQPVACVHCENAPCESVCPVAATVHSPDGTNQMIYNRCIGTRYCANNCPYKVRRFNFYNWTKTLPVELHMQHNPNVTVRSRGVMEKCSYCIQRVRAVQQRAGLEERTIADGEILTACQQACPAEAITFGDMNDPNSKIAQMKQDHRRYEMLGYLNVKPRSSYLARLSNPNPALGTNA